MSKKWISDSVYKAKGYINFRLDKTTDGKYSLMAQTIPIDEMVEGYISKTDTEEYKNIVKEDIVDRLSTITCDIMDGMEFLYCVRDGSIMNYDGFICNIFVDGYKSNLGLASDNGFIDGDFLVDENVWEELCREHKIEVDWANK